MSGLDAPDVEAMLAPLMATGASMGQALGMVAATMGAAAVEAHFRRVLHTGRAKMPIGVLMAFLDEVAQASPETANAWLASALMAGSRVCGMKHSLLADQMVFRGCSWLAELPPDWSGKWDLDLDDCPNLTALPEGLVVHGSMSVDGCPSLSALPTRMRVFGNLSFKDCASLIHIPPGTSVAGRLSIDGCPSFVSLPGRMAIRGGRGGYEIQGCPAWDGCLPGNTRGDAMIRTDLHPGGVEYQEWKTMHPMGERVPLWEVYRLRQEGKA